MHCALPTRQDLVGTINIENLFFFSHLSIVLNLLVHRLFPPAGAYRREPFRSTQSEKLLRSTSQALVASASNSLEADLSLDCCHTSCQ